MGRSLGGVLEGGNNNNDNIIIINNNNDDDDNDFELMVGATGARIEY